MQNLPDNLIFAGSVPQQELFKAFEDSDVLVFPTLSDGFGMVVTEAFSRGLPVITTDQAGAAELVINEKNGLIIKSGSAEAIESSISWCLDNRNRLKDMREAALATANAWQWKDYRKTLIETLDQGLRQSGFTTHFGSSRAGNG